MISSSRDDSGASTGDLGSLFTKALACNETEQSRLLDSLKQNNPALADQLAQLLQSYHRFDHQVEQGKVADPQQTYPGWTEGTVDYRPKQGLDDPMPDHVGPYTVESELGRGATARVFLAMQQSPQRRVAVKLIPGRKRGSQLLKRFRHEYQALALMRHPNIATVFDVGQTPVGDAWIAMELAPGTELTRYCREQKLDRVQRIILFMSVLDGINHAHGQGVIHRDLKPSNIIAFNLDGRHMVKIIDFGLARSLEQTQEGSWAAVGTPAYMAPELLTPGTNKAPNVAADIYALGIIFHELMTDRHPFDLEALRKLSPPEAFRHLREVRPQFPKEYPKDLGWVFAKATDPDPQKRYASVSQFRDDIGRFLDHRPVLGAPKSRRYAFKKLVRRHRNLFAMFTVLLLTLVSGFTYITVSRDQAIEAKERFQVVNLFLNKMLAAPHPKEQGWDVRMVDVLQNAEERLKDDQLKDPEVLFPLSITLGNTYLGLSLYDKAAVHLERAVKIASGQLRKDMDKRAQAYDLLAKVRRRQENYGEAETCYQKAIDLWEQIDGPRSRRALKARFGLITSWDMAGDKVRAAEAYEVLLQQQEVQLGALDEDTLRTLVGLANSLEPSNQPLATQYYELALERLRQTLGPTDPSTLSCEYNLAVVWLRQGRYGDAEALMKQNLASRQNVLGPTYHYTLSSMNALGQIYYVQGRYEDAMAIWHKLWDAYQSTELPPRHSVRSGLYNLAKTYAECGDNETALSIYLELLDLSETHQLNHHTLVLRAMQNTGNTAMEMGFYTLADLYLNECLKIKTAVMSAISVSTLHTQLTLGKLAHKQGNHELAKKRYEDTMKLVQLHHPDSYLAPVAQKLYKQLTQ